jgi:cytochrome bd-type quinol oxidase subunit 2
MSNITHYPFPAYECNVAAAGVLAAFIGVLSIAWIVQAIQAHFKPRRMNILLLISNLSLFVELVLRASLSVQQRDAKPGWSAMTVLFAVSHRLIILANYDFLVRLDTLKPCASRSIIIGTFLLAITSSILMAPAETASYDESTIGQSFRLRQASAALILILAVLFYLTWFATKTFQKMTKQAIVLLLIASTACLITAIYLVVSSVPDNYIATNEEEWWFYTFQFTPVAISLLTWNILHPKRSLEVPIEQQEEKKAKPDTGTNGTNL